jgi:hypothetical protein
MVLGHLGQKRTWDGEEGWQDHRGDRQHFGEWLKLVSAYKEEAGHRMTTLQR